MSSRPNILILMVDQFNGTLFPDGPADFLHAPHLKSLAKRSVRFANTYTASPLCAPARASFMSGQLPSRTRVYDNAAEFASDIPTFAHHLRAAGYQTLMGVTHYNPSEEEQLLREQLLHRPAGLLITGLNHNAATRALIARSLRLLADEGMAESALAVDGENLTGANRVYEDCGFQVVKRNTIYRKPLEVPKL